MSDKRLRLRLRLRLIYLNRIAEKYNYLSELRSCEKRIEEGGSEETAGGRWGGGRESGRRVKSYNER